MIRNARADVDAGALQHNFQRVKRFAPNSRAMAVIKADAYGHGMVQAARTLQSLADGFAVACVAEARVLRDAGIRQPITVFQGVRNVDELHQAAALQLRPVLHQHWQLDLLQSVSLSHPVDVWLKLDTGMGRLGLNAADVPACWRVLVDSEQVGDVGLMSHFANADEPGDPSVQRQIDTFNQVRAALPNAARITTSLCNSAGLIAHPNAQGDWVRPGIMLYGSSPLNGRCAHDLELRPVMTLHSEIIAINPRRQDDPVGYGSEWRCPEDMPVGVVAIGYGDGYPRHARQGTPVWINGRRSQLLGRVSMDMITVDLRGIDARCGDEVVLWGGPLSVDEVAACAGTIGYQLLCNVSGIRTN